MTDTQTPDAAGGTPADDATTDIFVPLDAEHVEPDPDPVDPDPAELVHTGFADVRAVGGTVVTVPVFTPAEQIPGDPDA